MSAALKSSCFSPASSKIFLQPWWLPYSATSRQCNHCSFNFKTLTVCLGAFSIFAVFLYPFPCLWKLIIYSLNFFDKYFDIAIFLTCNQTWHWTNHKQTGATNQAFDKLHQVLVMRDSGVFRVLNNFDAAVVIESWILYEFGLTTCNISCIELLKLFLFYSFIAKKVCTFYTVPIHLICNGGSVILSATVSAEMAFIICCFWLCVVI